MEWLQHYWWILLIIIAGMFIDAIKKLNKIDAKKYLDKKKSVRNKNK